MYLAKLSLFVIFLISFCFVSISNEIDLTKGPFRIKLNKQGDGKIFYKNQAILLGIKPQPYMRKKNYSRCTIPDNVNVIEEKKDGPNYLITIQGGNPGYMGYLVKIKLTANEIKINKSFVAYGNLNNLKCVALGCRYYIPKKLLFEKELIVTCKKAKKLKMRESLPRWISYGLKKMRIPMTRSELIIDLSEDKNCWYLQNLQKSRNKKIYLLFYENKEWNTEIKDFKWEQKLTIRIFKNK